MGNEHIRFYPTIPPHKCTAQNFKISKRARRYNTLHVGSPQLPLVISVVEPKAGGQNGRNVNDAEGRAAALHAQSARHDRGPCRIQCGRRWLLRCNCHTPLLMLGMMLLLG